MATRVMASSFFLAPSLLPRGTGLSSLPPGTVLHYGKTRFLYAEIPVSPSSVFQAPLWFRLSEDRKSTELHDIGVNTGSWIRCASDSQGSSKVEGGAKKSPVFKTYRQRREEASSLILRATQGRDLPGIDSLLNLGEAYRVLGDLERSEQVLQDLLSQHSLDDKRRARTFSALAVTLREGGRLAEAIQAIDQAIWLKPRNPHYHCEKGVLRFARKDFQGAQDEIRLAQDLDPTKARFYCEMAIVRISLGQFYETRGDSRGAGRYFRGALQNIAEAIRLNPLHPRSYVEQAILFRILGNLKEALKAHEKSIALDPTHPRHLEERDITLRLMGKAP